MTEQATSAPRWRTAAHVALGVVAIALCARISVPIPGTPVPQSLQTLAVVLVGLTLGPARGSLTVGAYVLLGTIGAPVFADGGGGLAGLLGPTGGYLVGFVFGAVVAGLPWVVAPLNSGLGAFGTAVVAHVVILACGWARLATMVGAGSAFSSGVAPFVIGGLVKAAVAAIVWGRFLAPLHSAER